MQQLVAIVLPEGFEFSPLPLTSAIIGLLKGYFVIHDIDLFSMLIRDIAFEILILRIGNFDM